MKPFVPEFKVRPFESNDEHRQCENLQRQVWVGDAEVPSNMTITLARHGGLAIGAFDNAGHMLGFVLGLLAPAHQAGAARGLCHHSHIAAVLPGLQSKGIGEAIKQAQADAVRASGLNLMTWTYDPLEAKNARLNIAKLGAICRVFLPNFYGEMRDALNQGLPSDRFEVEWWLDRAAEPDGTQVMAGGALRQTPGQSALEIDIPRDFQALKRHSLSDAAQVRNMTRRSFQAAFAAGYAATDFTRLPDRAYYSLTKIS